MNKAHITLLAFLTAITTLADNPPTHKNYSAEAQVTGGIGSVNPWAAMLKEELGGNNIKIQSYFGIRGISNSSSGQDEDTRIIYSGKAPLSTSKDYGYSSSRHTNSKGITFNYGMSASYAIDQSNAVTASVKGETMRINTSGNQTEKNYMPQQLALDNAFSMVKSVMDGKWHKDNIEMAVGYSYTTKARQNGHSDKLSIDYTYNRESNDVVDNQKVVAQTGFSDFATNNQKADNVTEKHRVQGGWLMDMKNIKLNTTAFYENRQIESNNHNAIYDATNNPVSLVPSDEHFDHKYNTVGGTVSAWAKMKNVVMDARIEYDYTEMAGKYLNDVLPTASVEWNIDAKNNLGVRYARRLIRPGIDELNPAKIRKAYTMDYGNPDMEGIHANNVMLTYRHKGESSSYSATLNHIFVADGFNAIWMEKNGVRMSTWGNEGVRRAWIFTPEMQKDLSQKTLFKAKATAIWDKRIAYAIKMSNEHWGMTLETGVQQQLPYGISMDVHARYSEGNTIDLYSYEGRNYELGTIVKRSFLKNNRLTAILEYKFQEYPKTIITQGAYVGDVYTRPSNHNAASLTLTYKL